MVDTLPHLTSLPDYDLLAETVVPPRSALAAAPLSAQQVTLGAGFASSDYREQADFLHFRGAGPAALLTVERGHRLSVPIQTSVARLGLAVRF